MHQPTSPRLPGVPLLRADATGPEYSRWRRAVKFASETKGTWKYCNGMCPMPMPQAGPNRKARDTSTKTLQPSLLEERRAWVRQDREVKLDVFLSMAEEAMQEVFQVGPPLPPSNLNAKHMIDALDEHFAEFKFGAYHHAFCHFLNLHIDQYATIEDFNKEFSATVEDLLDYGQPLSNTQACSAYFSKLRCTQNPWVAEKLEEWDAQSCEPELVELMKESPPWSFVRPLATKASQNFHIDSIPEESLEDSSTHSDSDAASEPSNASLVSSRTSHSRHTSSTTTHSQEITVHASSEDIVEIDPLAFRIESEKLSASAIPERRSSKDRVLETPLSDDVSKVPTAVPEWLSAKKSLARLPRPVPIDRPLPPLPPQALESIDTDTRSRPASPRNIATVSKNSSQISLTVPTSSPAAPTSSSVAQLPILKLETLKLETTHPTLRPRTPTPPLAEHPAFRVNAPSPNSSAERAFLNVHPALRPKTPTQQASSELHPALRARKPTPTPITTMRPYSPLLKLPEFVSSSPTLAIPWPSTPDEPQRAQSSHAGLPFQVQDHEPAQQPEPAQAQNNDVSPELALLRLPQLTHIDSTTSSIISLPLQGTRDSAWDYLYESKNAPGENSVSPIESHSTSPHLGDHITALPQIKSTTSPAQTFDDIIISNKRAATPEKNHALHSKSSNMNFVARLSGDHMLESNEEAREKEQEKTHRKKKSWSVNVNLARFSASKGVKEMI